MIRQIALAGALAGGMAVSGSAYAQHGGSGGLGDTGLGDARARNLPTAQGINNGLVLLGHRIHAHRVAHMLVQQSLSCNEHSASLCGGIGQPGIRLADGHSCSPMAIRGKHQFGEKECI